MHTGTLEYLLGLPDVKAVEPTGVPGQYQSVAPVELPSSDVPESVTPWQIRKALNALGLRSAVEAAVASGSQDMKDGWEFATEIRRTDPLVLAMGSLLGKNPTEMDALFRQAASL